MKILQQMYRVDAQYQSKRQEQAMKHIVTETEQMLTVLQTSEEKSLLYLLLCQLPETETIMLILLLMILKNKMQHCCAETSIKTHV